MTKADLKTGMILENRAGRRGIVLLNTSNGDIIAGNDRDLDMYFNLSLLDDNLTRPDCSSESDIVKIYNEGLKRNYLNYDSKVLIWEREEENIMSISEIEEKLGIKNLKIKK